MTASLLSPVHHSSTRSDFAACVWVPLFPLQCEEQKEPELMGRPTAVLSPEDGRRLWQVSAIARRDGVKSGMTISQGMALCSSLVICKPDPAYYESHFADLILRLTEMSPIVEPAELGRAFLGADGLERLFGTPEQQLAMLARILGETFHDFRLGWGKGKFVAWVAASQAKTGSGVVVHDNERLQFLSSQSIAVLPVALPMRERLFRLGIRTLGQLASFPEPAIVSQFGKEGRQGWQLAAGWINDAVTGRYTPDPITLKMDFPNPLTDRLLVLQALEHLIEQAFRHPRRIGYLVRSVRVEAVLEQGSSWMAKATFKNPLANHTSVLEPFAMRLERTPPNGPIEQLVIEFTVLVPGTTELQLFARDATSAGLLELRLMKSGLVSLERYSTT